MSNSEELKHDKAVVDDEEHDELPSNETGSVEDFVNVSIKLPVLQPPLVPEGSHSSATNGYKYTPLSSAGQIRLLKLELLDSPDSTWKLVQTLICSMHIVNLDDDPKYDALSYTWGNPVGLSIPSEHTRPHKSWSERSYFIVCDGQEVRVATNLYTALLSFRWLSSITTADVTSQMAEADVQKPAYLWIDALCIDQENLDERSSQVAMMHRIYGQAKCSWVWLGGEDKLASGAINAITSIGSIDPTRKDLIGVDLNDERTYQIAGIPRISADTWVMVYAFANRSWFKRAWIVQEVVLAKKVVMVCGLKILGFGTVSRVFSTLTTLRWWDSIREIAEPHITGARSTDYFDTPMQGIDVSINLFQSYSWPLFDYQVLTRISNTRAGLIIGQSSRPGARALPLKVILQEQRFAEATDARDKVYAFLQISAEFFQNEDVIYREQLLPNYRKSITEVFTDATIFFIANQKNLQALSLVQDQSQTKLEELPSWVTDFSANGWPAPLDDGRPTPWAASASLGEFKFRLPTLKAQLPVQGVQISQIMEKVSYSFGGIPGFSDLLGVNEVSQISRPVMSDKLREFYRIGDISYWEKERMKLMVEADLLETSTEQSRLEVLWRTLLLDCFHGQHPASAECGDHFETMIKREIWAAEISLLSEFGNGNMEAWESGKTALSTAYEDWEMLRGVSFRDRLPWSQEFIRAMLELEDMPRDNISPELIQAAHLRLTIEKFNGVLPESEDLGGMREVKAKMSQVATKRQLFIAFGNLFGPQLGYGPSSLCCGDEIWLLVGADVPFVLRRCSEGEYRVIGEAYVHGIMHGEAVSRFLGTREILLQ